MSQTIRVGDFVIEQDIFYNFIVHIANNMSTLYTNKFINQNSTYYHIFTLEWRVALEYASIFFVFCTSFWFSFQVSQTLNTFQICFRRPNMVLLIKDQENQLGGSQGCQGPAWRPPNIIHFFQKAQLAGYSSRDQENQLRGSQGCQEPPT